MHNLDNHFYIKSHQQIDELVAPLKKTLALKSFVYQKSFRDGSTIRLGNQPQWFKYYYSQQLYQYSLFEHHPVKSPSGYVVWQQMSHHDKVLNAARDFDIGHGMTFSFPNHDYNEHYFFGLANHQERMMSHWLRNIDLFHHFVNFFHSRGKKLLDEAANHQLSIEIPSRAVLPHQESAWIEFTNPIDREQFFSDTPIDKFNISADSHLSKRELACARLLLQGNRAKTIADQLHISPRTAEGHLAKLKSKLNCTNQSQLFKKLVEIGLTV